MMAQAIFPWVGVPPAGDERIPASARLGVQPPRPLARLGTGEVIRRMIRLDSAAPAAPGGSFGHGSACTGSANCPGRQTASGRPGGARCGPPPWPGSAFARPGCTRHTRAPGSAGLYAAAPRPAGCTAGAMPRSPLACVWACAGGTTPLGSARRIPDAGMASGVAGPSAHLPASAATWAGEKQKAPCIRDQSHRDQSSDAGRSGRRSLLV